MSSDGSLKFDTKILTDGFNSGVNKLGSIAKGGLAVIGGAIGGAVVGFGALTKSALDSVSSLEQNVGGVETLFKNSADAVIANANRAYQTAGMSANDYMSTVTSFSASLLQSLSGNTEEAAKVADMAITDMSDNANKMGTSMELIQNAYQGFAKQNYTMLDNLKLGYGGTKTEMERLLKDAQKISGVKYDISNLNDVYEAIHAIQGELGITGTTKDEAASTIEGSINSAKAALDNFLAGSGSVDELVDAATTAGTVILKNLGEIVPRLLETVPEAIGKLGSEAIAALDELDTGAMIETGKEVAVRFANGMLSSAQEVTSAALDVLGALADTLTANAPGLTAKAGEIVSHLITGIQENAPSMITSAVELLASFVQGIGEQLPQLVPQALQMVVTLADSIISNIPTIVSAGISLLKGLVLGIVNSIPTLISEVPRIINDFADAIYAGLGDLILAGLEMIASLVQGLWENKGLIVENAGEILLAFLNVFSLSKLLSLGKGLISSMASGIKSLGPNIVSAGKNIITNLLSGIKSLATHPIATIKGIVTSIKNVFTSLSWSSIGKNIISGIASGISGAVGTLIEAAANAAEDALEWVKKKLGIHSPSRVFRDEVGKMMALGIGEGFEKNIPTDDIGKSIDGVITKATKKVAKVTTSNPSGVKSVVRNTTNNYTDAQVDYRKIKEAQKEAMNEANERPIVLNEREINRATKK